MESRVAVSESEILDAIREALTEIGDQPDDAFTTTELVEQTGKGPAGVRAAIRELVKKGDATCVWVQRTAMDGRRARVPAYRIGRKAAA